MPQPELDNIAQRLADRLSEDCCDYYESGVWFQLLQHLATGQSISTSRLAASVDLSLDKTLAILNRSPDIEFDRQGNIVGMGLSLKPTRHCFQVNGQALFTWCALDTLVYPIVLGQPAHIRSSCPVTGMEVRLLVTPDGITNLNPVAAVISIVIPDASQTCCRHSFCNQGHFFCSVEATTAWLADRPDAFILSVGEAFQVGYKLAKRFTNAKLKVDGGK